MQQHVRAFAAVAVLRSSRIASRGLCWRFDGRGGKVVVRLRHWLGNVRGARSLCLVMLRITTALRTCTAARLHASEQTRARALIRPKLGFWDDVEGYGAVTVR